MPEELYNSHDYCTLAEELEKLKLENEELIADKIDLCKALEADYAISNRELLILQVEISRLNAELARLTALVERLKEDAERLASTYVIEVFPHEWVCRGGCHHWARFGEQIEHSPDCPITLHRALMKEVE